ncbi:phosphoenolpyruvate carboxykinase (GTP), partial [bacterium]|nr:phosphoenolpyruvate carboxykinase (GTP) [bacterium]
MIKYAHVQEWVDQMAAMCQPARVYWCDGSEKEKRRLTAQAVRRGELTELNRRKMPGCFLHRTATNDVARTEHLTFICTSFQADAGPTNNWMSPRVAYRKGRELFAGTMKGRTMYVVPFSMGPIGSPFSKIGIELTDSIYVVLNMRIMTRMGETVLDALGPNGEFTKCLHSKADLDVNRRLILHFPEDNAIWSVGSGYGGNVLLGKKCLALRIASVLAQREKWFAEHMLILGIEEPNGRIQYIAGAFPSACGKTNLAMLLPPAGLQKKGYRIWTVGDDIAWMRVDTDGQLWAVNPEMGFFGVVPGTNSQTNRNALATISHDSILTNVALRPDGTTWWEGHDDPPPARAIDWQGNRWKPGRVDKNGKPVFAAHPNSRFTAPFTNAPTHSFRFDQHHGVPISAIVFGGRRPKLSPLVYEAFDWAHGVYVGASMASERTAAQVGKLGEVRRDPMAMIPFCGYN